MDVWRAGPLDPSDLSWLRELAAAFPPAAHALAVPDSRPMRLRSPEALVRDLWDAIADTIARSPAAARTTASTAFAATEPTGVSDLADWLADTTDGLSAGARLGLRIEAVPAATAFPAEDALPGQTKKRMATRELADERPGRRTACAGVPAGAAVAQHQRPEPDRRRRRTVEPAGDRARQVRPAGGDGPAARAAPRGSGMAAARTGARAGQPFGDRPGRRRAHQPARPGGRGPGRRRHRGDVAVQHARRRPGAAGRRHAGPGAADRSRVRARGAAGIPLAAHARRRAARRRRDRRPGGGETAADQAAGPLGDPRPGAARPAAPSAANADAHDRGARRGAGGRGGDRRRDRQGHRRRTAGRPRRADREPRVRCRNRSSHRPGSTPRCGPTSSAVWRGWPGCAIPGSAAASPTTWAWARRSRSSRCTCTGETSRRDRRSWCARPRCSAPGSARSGGSPRKSRSAGSTAAGGTCRTWPSTRWSWSLTAWCCAIPSGSLRSAGAWSSPTRPSTRRTRSRGPPANCGPFPLRRGSR